MPVEEVQCFCLSVICVTACLRRSGQKVRNNCLEKTLNGHSQFSWRRFMITYLYFKRGILRNTKNVASYILRSVSRPTTNTPSLFSYSFNFFSSIATHRQDLHYGKYPYGITSFPCPDHKLIFHYSVSARILCRSPSRIIR